MSIYSFMYTKWIEMHICIPFSRISYINKVVNPICKNIEPIQKLNIFLEKKTTYNFFLKVKCKHYILQAVKDVEFQWTKEITQK